MGPGSEGPEDPKGFGFRVFRVFRVYRAYRVWGSGFRVPANSLQSPLLKKGLGFRVYTPSSSGTSEGGALAVSRICGAQAEWRRLPVCVQHN